MARPPPPIDACWSDDRGEVEDYGVPTWCDLFRLRFVRVGVDYRCHEFKEARANDAAEEIVEVLAEPCRALDLHAYCLVPRHWRYGMDKDVVAAVTVRITGRDIVYKLDAVDVLCTEYEMFDDEDEAITFYEMYTKNHELAGETFWRA